MMKMMMMVMIKMMMKMMVMVMMITMMLIIMMSRSELADQFCKLDQTNKCVGRLELETTLHASLTIYHHLESGIYFKIGFLWMKSLIWYF